ncbi:hypothetical protein C8J57DRAFT_403933 [Mycena rebaudengoi]|nr:hypothetical protein C8J57DRAFT_403933 [Mycena rebaudengoi]
MSRLEPTSPVQHAVVGSVAGTQAASRPRKNKPSFRCKFEACSATFTSKHNLKNHMNSHYGIRPYGCPKCDATFTTPAVKSRHFKSCKGFRSKRSSSAQGSSSSPTSYQ